MATYQSKHTGAEIDAGIDAANSALPKSGGTMSGTLTLNGNPSEDNHAASKKYVDDLIEGIGSAVSPTVSVSAITGGHRVTITDANGTKYFDVMDGKDGADGSGSSGGSGTDGEDGYSPTITISTISGGHRVYVTDVNGTKSFDVMDGEDGTNGTNGSDGADGISPTVSISTITDGHRVYVTDVNGTKYFDVMDGADGSSGSADKSTIVDMIYPVGSIYMSVNSTNPSTLFGGTWVQIKDRFLLAAGSTYTNGASSSTGVSKTATVSIPAHKHLTPLVKSGNYLGFWTSGSSKSVTATNRIAVTGSASSSSTSATTYYTQEDGECTADVTIPPTIPPYLVVNVWKRTA